MELKQREEKENEVSDEIKEKIIYMKIKYKMTPTALMYKFDISLNQVKNILYNAKYKKYRADYNERIKNGVMIDKRAQAMFSDEQMVEMIELRNNGATYQKIAKLYNCTMTTVRNYIIRYRNMNKIAKEEVFTNAEMAEMHRLRTMKFTYVDIAEYFKTDPSLARYYIMKYIKKKNIDINTTKIHKPKYSEEEIEELIKLREKGLSYKKIAKAVNGNASTVMLYIKKYYKNKV